MQFCEWLCDWLLILVHCIVMIMPRLCNSYAISSRFQHVDSHWQTKPGNSFTSRPVLNHHHHHDRRVHCLPDVIKTKLQAQGSFRRQQVQLHGSPPSSAVYRGLVGTAKTIINQDGLKGMYRGLGPMLLGYLPTWAVYMTVYDKAKDVYSHRVGESDRFTFTRLSGTRLTLQNQCGSLTSTRPSRPAPARP